MRSYSFGSETVPVAMADDVIIGSVKIGKRYEIMLARVKGEEIISTRFISGNDDWEGHSLAKVDNGYIIGGAVEGKATSEGGEAWKAYVAGLDMNLNVIWERKIGIRNNGAVYTILPFKEEIFIAGEAGKPYNKGFFLGKLSLDGELLTLKDFGSWKDAFFTALLPSEGSILLIGSVKEESWNVRVFEINNNFELLREESLSKGIAFTACQARGKLILAGYREDKFWIRIGEHNIELGEGTATSLLRTGNKVIVGGELIKDAVIVEICEEADPKVRVLWKNGWVEVLSEDVVAGIVDENRKTKMVIESLNL